MSDVGNRTATWTVAEERRLGSGCGLFGVGLSAVVHEGGGGGRAESWRERCREFRGGGMGKEGSLLELV